MSLRQVCVQTSFGTSDLFYSMNCHILQYNWMPNKAVHIILSVVIHKSINSKNDPSQHRQIKSIYIELTLKVTICDGFGYCFVSFSALPASEWRTEPINRWTLFIFKSPNSQLAKGAWKRCFCKWFIDESAALRPAESAVSLPLTPQNRRRERRHCTELALAARGSTGDILQINES